MESAFNGNPPLLVLAAIGALGFGIVLRIYLVMRWIRVQKKGSVSIRRRIDPMKTLVVLGSGGHTTEMLHLLKNLDPQRYAPLIFIVAELINGLTLEDIIVRARIALQLERTEFEAFESSLRVATKNGNR